MSPMATVILPESPATLDRDPSSSSWGTYLPRCPDSTRRSFPPVLASGPPLPLGQGVLQAPLLVYTRSLGHLVHPCCLQSQRDDSHTDSAPELGAPVPRYLMPRRPLKASTASHRLPDMSPLPRPSLFPPWPSPS